MRTRALLRSRTRNLATIGASQAQKFIERPRLSVTHPNRSSFFFNFSFAWAFCWISRDGSEASRGQLASQRNDFLVAQFYADGRKSRRRNDSRWGETLVQGYSWRR